jgi:hypothetical protein
MFGLVVGILRMILEFSYSAPACGEMDRRPAVLKDFHYLYFALLLCGLTAIIIVVISFFTEPIPDDKASGSSSASNAWNAPSVGLHPAGSWSHQLPSR